MTTDNATVKTPSGSALYYPIMVVLAAVALGFPVHLGYNVIGAAEGLYGFLTGLAVAWTMRQYLRTGSIEFDNVLITGLCFCFGITLVMTYPHDETQIAWMIATGTAGLTIHALLGLAGIAAPPTQTL